jgi:N-acetylmuramoyl-L-alanine amidase
MAHGNEVLEFSRQHVTDPPQRYLLGAFVPKDAVGWRGPWDCAEMGSYDYYQVAKILFGTTSHDDPATADAWSRAWLDDARRLGRLVPVAHAAQIPGAVILRVGIGAVGHVVIADGRGGTVEAHSAARGVIAGSLSERRWTHGVLVPGVKYEPGAAVKLSTPQVWRLTSPRMTGETVREIQLCLLIRGYQAGQADGIFGPMTYAAVLEFQRAAGLLVDGEAGPLTLAALRK